MEGCLVRRKSLAIWICLLILAAAGAGVAANATAVRAYWIARQLRAAATDEARDRAADRLIALGGHGLARLVEFIRADDESCRAAAVRAIARRIESTPEADTWTLTTVQRLEGAMTGADAPGQRAILELVPKLLARTGPDGIERCRGIIAAALASADASVRAHAVRLTLHPEIKMRREAVALLADSAAEVRAAALVATAMPGDGEPLIGDEDLFRWLHDPDEQVRVICHGALVSRDRTEAEIALGRRLTHPDPRERLMLLLDLRHDDELADPEPWLERLSRDLEPAVRAGAVRTAVEIRGERRLGYPAWVGRVAEADPDPTVRRVAAYFRGVPVLGAPGTVRPAAGP
jgi:hypothetical protein